LSAWCRCAEGLRRSSCVNRILGIFTFVSERQGPTQTVLSSQTRFHRSLLSITSLYTPVLVLHCVTFRQASRIILIIVPLVITSPDTKRSLYRFLVSPQPTTKRAISSDHTLSVPAFANHHTTACGPSIATTQFVLLQYLPFSQGLCSSNNILSFSRKELQHHITYIPIQTAATLSIDLVRHCCQNGF